MLTSAGFNNPSAQGPSGDKITDVNLTPSFSPAQSDFSFKSSSVNNQENKDGSEDDKKSAPTKDQVSKSVKLRTNNWRKKNKKLSMTKLIMRRAVRRSNDLESPENSRTSQGDMDVSSLVKQALKRGKNEALKQAEKTAGQYPQETPTEDKNKLLKMAVLWKQKNRDPRYKEKSSSRDKRTAFDNSSSETRQHSINRDPEATSEPSYGRLESMTTSVLQSMRPTSVTDVPYVTRPRPTPKLVNLLMDAPNSATQTNPSEYLKTDPAETEVELNLNNGESASAESAKPYSEKAEMKLNLSPTQPTTAKSAKSHSEKAELQLNLPLTQWATADPTRSDSDLNLNLNSYEPPNYFGSSKSGPAVPQSSTSESEKAEMEMNLPTTQPTTAESAKSDPEKAEMKPNLPTTQLTTAESAKSHSEKAELQLNLPLTQWATADPTRSDSDLNLNLNSYEPPNYFGSSKSGAAVPNPKLNLQTAESSSSDAPQATPEDTAQPETTMKGPSENNRGSDFPYDQLSVSGQEGSSHHGTSTTQDVNMNVHPRMSASSGLRWHVALERRDTSDNGKDKHSKKKKKHKSHSTTKDPADSGSPIIVGGVVGGIFMLMAIVTCFIQLW